MVRKIDTSSFIDYHYKKKTQDSDNNKKRIPQDKWTFLNVHLND